MATPLTPSQKLYYHESKQQSLVGSLTVFLVLGNLSVAAKLYSQARSSKKILIEDFFLILALASANTVCASYLRATHYGLGLHVYRVASEDPHLPQRLLKVYYYIWLPAVFNGPVFVGIKLCLLFLYRRLFLVSQKWLKIAWYGNLVYLILWFTGSFFYYIFACTPPSFYWNRLYSQFHKKPPHPVSGTCVRTTVAEGALPLIFGVIQDFALLLLPAITLAKLQMSARKKLGLMSLFSLGLLACILEIARIIDLAFKTGIKGWSKLTDPTYDLVGFAIMTCAVEMIAIMCACFPVIAPFIFKGFEELRSTWSRSQGGNSLRRILARSSRKSGPESGESSENLQDNIYKMGKVSGGGYRNLEEPTKPDQVQIRTDIDVQAAAS